MANPLSSQIKGLPESPTAELLTWEQAQNRSRYLTEGFEVLILRSHEAHSGTGGNVKLPTARWWDDPIFIGKSRNIA